MSYTSIKLRDLMYEIEAEEKHFKDEIGNRDRRLAELTEQLRQADERERALEVKNQNLIGHLAVLVLACRDLDLTGEHTTIVRIRESVTRAQKLLNPETP